MRARFLRLISPTTITNKKKKSYVASTPPLFSHSIRSAKASPRQLNKCTLIFEFSVLVRLIFVVARTSAKQIMRSLARGDTSTPQQHDTHTRPIFDRQKKNRSMERQTSLRNSRVGVCKYFFRHNKTFRLKIDLVRQFILNVLRFCNEV